MINVRGEIFAKLFCSKAQLLPISQLLPIPLIHYCAPITVRKLRGENLREWIFRLNFVESPVIISGRYHDGRGKDIRDKCLCK